MINKNNIVHYIVCGTLPPLSFLRGHSFESVLQSARLRAAYFDRMHDTGTIPGSMSKQIVISVVVDSTVCFEVILAQRSVVTEVNTGF